MARSHFSGGSSSGRSHSSSSSGRSHSSSSRSYSSSSSRSYHSSSRPSVHYHGHYSHHHHGGGVSVHVKASPLTVAIVIILFIMFGVTAGLFGTFSSTAFLNEDLKIIEQSYNHYQNMIKYAEQNPELIVEGVVERTGYASEFDLFYVVYSVENDKGWTVISHAESFAMYSATEISKYKKDSPIYIVVESLPIEYTTDNINLDYKNVSLEEDAEYAYVVNQIKSTNITKVVLILIDATCLAVIVLLIVKNVKKKKQEELESSTNTSSTSTPTTATPVSKYCEYCGSKLSDSALKCPLCGAHIKK